MRHTYNLHPLSHSVRRIVPCIIVHQISQMTGYAAMHSLFQYSENRVKASASERATEI